MKRDFSDSAKTKLISLIDEVNEEQWFGWTDFLGDLFCWGLNIEDYLDDLDSYHKKVVDKNNTTEEQINTIFENVAALDSSYAKIFENSRQTIQEQIDYIKALAECIDPAVDNFTLDFVEQSMKQKEESLFMSMLDYYTGKIKTDNGDYDYEYINEIMSQQPEDVSPEMYLALIKVFNKMNTSQKEKFIESSYFVGGFLSWKDGSGKNVYHISEVFKSMTSVYGQLISSVQDSDDSKTKKILSDYNILNAIAYQADSVYVVGSNTFGSRHIDDIDIKIEKTNPENDMYDYTITFNGSKKVSNDMGLLDLSEMSINIYEMRNGTNVDAIFDNYAIDLTESLREDENLDNAKAVAGIIKDLGFNFVDMSLKASNVLTAGDAVKDIIIGAVEENYNNKITNETVDKIQSLLTDANAYNALAMNASFSFCDDGTYTISCFKIDKVELNNRLKAWQEQKKVSVDYDADDVVEKIKCGELYELEKMEEFLEWYCTENGSTKTDKFDEGERKE